MANLNYIKAMSKNSSVGAVTPSSKHVVRAVVNKIKPGHKFIIEYGAGDGVMTKEILKKLPSDGRLIVIEINKSFIKKLKKIKDDRLTIINDDVVNISEIVAKLKLPKIHGVISGIPFSLIKPDKREKIIENTYSALSDSGVFLIYQYVPVIFFTLKKVFKNKIKFHFEPRNFLPYFIMTAVK